MPAGQPLQLCLSPELYLSEEWREKNLTREEQRLTDGAKKIKIDKQMQRHVEEEIRIGDME